MPQYQRYKNENYGPSTIELIEVDMSKEYVNINIDGTEVFLPVLNLQKYDSNCKCYVIVEKLKNYPIKMLDILYTYKDIFFDDENFRKKFFSKFNRININCSCMKFPGIMFVPEDFKDANVFKNTVVLAAKDAVTNKICISQNKLEEQVEIKTYPDPNKVKKDGMILSFIKDFYEIMFETKISRPTDPKIKKVNCSINKESIFMKSGSIIINGIETSKYLTSFQTESILPPDEEYGIIKNMMAIYITGVDDYKLLNDEEYNRSFGDVILNSHILETSYAINQDNLPIFDYAGEYSYLDKKLLVNRNIEKYFDKMNELIINDRQNDYNGQR